MLKKSLTCCCLWYLGLDARKPVFGICEQHRRRPACAPAQSDQRLCYSPFGTYHMLTCYRWNFSFLASLCSWGDCFETRFVRNPKDRFSRDEAHLIAFEIRTSQKNISYGTVFQTFWKKSNSVQQKNVTYMFSL